ncbi:MAG: phosphate ABC transporter permease subunit PstC [Coriobacteriia bacterium]|nr:phosphate ABC transporter permease subunit PstC [Coriobacteriia bacterium]
MTGSGPAPGPTTDPRPEADQTPTGSAGEGLSTISRATYFKEAALKNIFLVCACVAVAGVALIFLFVGLRGWPIFAKIGLGAFLGGGVWHPTDGKFGILALIVNSLLATLGALAIGAPLAVGTAVFLSEVASPKVRGWVRPAVELLAGIPSVVYGFFGLVLLRPIVADLFGGLGFGLFTAWIILAVMIVPTIAAISEDALRSVPNGIREASYAMGATKWQTIWRVLLPAAKIGIIDAIILGMGRAIGETMAVVMVAGNAPVIPDGIFAPFLTLTTVIVMDMPYASGDHRTALFGVAIVLFLISMCFVAAIRLVSRFGKAVG